MKLLHSLSFRLTLLYMLLFCGSVVMLGAAHYWITIRRPLQAVEQRIDQESQALGALYRGSGEQALEAALDQRAGTDSGRKPFHAFITRAGQVRTANLPIWPAQHRDRWQRLDADTNLDGELQDHEALTRDILFEDGARLLVGRDIEDIDELEEKLLTAVVGMVVGSLILGVLGGLLMSRVIGSRIGLVTRTARRVMRGDLSGRVPLRGSADDFDQLGATLNEMLARTEQLLESVRRVSDNVAHELRTPLARMRGSLENLRAANDRPSPELIDSILGEVESLEKTFDAVLRIARIESGRHGAVMGSLDVSALLADAAELYAPEIERRRQRLQLDIEPSLVVQGDRDLLFQSFCNLLDNAIKYSPDGGAIRITAGSTAEGVDIAVTDEGPGIAPEHRPHVVERFYRVPATAGAPGAGLGLSLVAAVAERHGAVLTFEDAAPGLTVRWRARLDSNQ